MAIAALETGSRRWTDRRRAMRWRPRQTSCSRYLASRPRMRRKPLKIWLWRLLTVWICTAPRTRYTSRAEASMLSVEGGRARLRRADSSGCASRDSRASGARTRPHPLRTHLRCRAFSAEQALVAEWRPPGRALDQDRHLLDARASSARSLQRRSGAACQVRASAAPACSRSQFPPPFVENEKQDLLGVPEHGYSSFRPIPTCSRSFHPARSPPARFA